MTFTRRYKFRCTAIEKLEEHVNEYLFTSMKHRGTIFIEEWDDPQGPGGRFEMVCMMHGDLDEIFTFMYREK